MMHTNLNFDSPDELMDDVSTDQNQHRPASRRSFLGSGLASVPATLAAAAVTAQAAAPKAATSKAPPSLYSGWTKRNFAEIRKNENSHLEIVITAILSLGGTPRPKPTFQNLTAANQLQFAQMSASFENVGTAAYFGSGPFIVNPNVSAVATSLGLVEAYQSGWLNTLLNTPIVPGASTYQIPAYPEQVVPFDSPYIVSLNDNGLFPPTYARAKSPENDIAILNFALIQEYLETEFYNLNFPRLFGV